MRIGIVAPVWKPVPPKKYGGTELVVYHLTEGLIKRGHEVTLFASGDSKTSAKLFPIIEKNLYEILGGFDWKELSYDILQGEIVAKCAHEFEIIHNHNGFVPLAFTSFIKTPVITTLHSSLPPEPKILAEKFKDRYFVSISNAQRQLAPYLNYIATVYHGIDIKKYQFSEKEGEYLLFMATFSPYKGPDIAIEVAKKARLPIILAGEIRNEFKDFFEQKVKAFEDKENVIIKGELSHEEKVELLKGAIALLMPIRWNEAFGLVMIEAMACGTPVIAPRRASVPEIVVDEVTGFIVSCENMIDEMVEKLKHIHKISPIKCRNHVEQNFTADLMVERYLKVYENVLNIHQPFEILKRLPF
ncbi:glycosyltransferase family 4 protein [Thermodesulfovibrio hydrogeniphilus]